MGPVSETAVVDGELPCFRCLYDLRGQPADGRCPECGEPLAASTRGDRWDRADARWRRGVRRGLVWTAGEYGVVLAGAAGQLWWSDDWVLFLVFTLMGIAGMVGAWKVTAAEPTKPADRSPGRRAVRWLTAATGLASAAVATAVWTADDAEVSGVPVGPALVVAWCALNGAKQAAMACYARALLLRVPGRPLRRSSVVWAAVAPAGWWGFIAALVVNRLFHATVFGWRPAVVVLLAVLAAFLATAVLDLLVWRALRRARR